MSKPGRSRAKPLSDLVGKCLSDVFARQGFASRDIVTHWEDIVGTEIAAIAEPMRIKWPQGRPGDDADPAVLLLRVEGPAAIEVQHMSPILIERINRFFGWHAIGRVAFQQAPLRRQNKPRNKVAIDTALAESIAAQTGIADEPLRAAIGRLGAAIKRT